MELTLLVGMAALMGLIFLAVYNRGERAGGSARVYTVLSAVVACVAVAALAVSAAGALLPREEDVSDYRLERLEEAYAAGRYLDEDALDGYGDSVAGGLAWTGATGDKYDKYWEIVAAAEAHRDGLYWKAAAAAHPEEADCTLYWQDARDRLRAIRDGTAHGDNARAIGRMLEELD